MRYLCLLFISFFLFVQNAFATSVTVYGTAYDGTYNTDGGVTTSMAPAFGITSLTFAEYSFGEPAWSGVASKLASSVGAPPSGSAVVWAALFTADSSPASALSLTNVVGVSYVYRTTAGDLHHRMYFRNAGGTAYVENSGFRDQLIGGIPCDLLSMLQAVTLGSLPASSTIYLLHSSSTPAYSTGLNMDQDVFLYTMYTYPWASGATSAFVRTEPFDDATLDDPWGTGVTADCREGVFGGSCEEVSSEQCDAFSNSCGGSDSSCLVATLSADQLYNTNIELLHDFRDRLWAYSGLNKYVAAYVLYCHYEGMSNVSAVIQAMPGIEQAAYRVLHGSASQVIVNGPLKTKMTNIISHAQGKSASLDVLLGDLQAKLDATVGMTRSQFCVYMVNDSDCTP